MARKPAPANLDIRPKVGKSLEPPAHAPVSAEARPYFDAIIIEMPVRYWTTHTLARASSLAAHMAMLTSENQLLADEGAIISSARGLQRNPRVEVVNNLQRLITVVARSMALDARTLATTGMKGRKNMFSALDNAVSQEDSERSALSTSDLLASRARARTRADS